MNLGLTCIVPAHNEGLSIYETLLELDESFKSLMPFTIFVSEDGSRDNTRDEVLRASMKTSSSRILLSQPSDRLGYSKAVQRGILECQTEFICFIDADGQYDPKDIQKLLNQFTSTTSVIVGYRNPRADNYNRIIYSRLFGVLYRLLGGPKLKDPSSPMLIARTKDIKKIASINFHLTFGFWWEFQWRIHSLGIDVLEIPITHRNRSAGKTQVYSLRKIPSIVYTHVIGLLKLKEELS
jgi:glycosyltransferase involved in cell wall biosynthesis